MVYVDLNPVRADMTDEPTKAPHTSIKRRFESSDECGTLAPLAELGFTLADYLELVRYTAAKTCSNDGSSKSVPFPKKRLEALTSGGRGDWIDQVSSHRHRYRAYGAPERIAAYAVKAERKWMRGYPRATFFAAS